MAGVSLKTSIPLRATQTLVVLALVAAGCGSGSHPTTDAGTFPTGRGHTVHIVMKVLEFTPRTVHARVGERVLWTNEDTSPHNVTYVSGPKFSSSRPVIPRKGTFSIRLTRPGAIHYYCSIHPWMKATIVVAP